MIQKLNILCRHCQEHTVIYADGGQLFVPFIDPLAPRKKRKYTRRRKPFASNLQKVRQDLAVGPAVRGIRPSIRRKAAARYRGKPVACEKGCGKKFGWRPARLQHEKFCK